MDPGIKATTAAAASEFAMEDPQMDPEIKLTYRGINAFGRGSICDIFAAF